MTAVQISTLTDNNFQTANINVLLWASMEPNITIIIAAIPTLRLLRASRGQTRHHQKLFSRDKIRIVRTDDSRASPMTVGAPIFKQHAAAVASTTTANSASAPPRPPRPTSNQSFWTDSSSILKGGDNGNPQQTRGLAHETSTEDLIQQSPVYSPGHNGPYSPGDINNNNLGDTLKPSTGGKRLTPLEEESSLRGSNVSGGMMMGNSNYASNFDSYYNGNNNNYRSSSKYSTGAFIDTYGSQAQNVVEGMELIVPLREQQQQRQQQQQQSQYPQYQQQYQQYPQSPMQNQNHARQQSSHRRKPSVAEAPMYMVPVTATGGYGGML